MKPRTHRLALGGCAVLAAAAAAAAALRTCLETENVLALVQLLAFCR